VNRTVNTSAALFAALLVVGAGNARAQAFPSKPIKIVIPFVAGTPEECGQFMKAEVERWTRVVERGGIKPE
jgi:hypothetical protein